MRLLLAEFWRDLSAQRTRAFLTLFAVFWGVLTVVLLLSFGEGLRLSVNAGLAGMGQRMFLIYGGETTREHAGLPAGRRIRLTEADLQRVLGSVPEIDLGSASYGRGDVELKTEHLTTTTFLEGVHPGFAEMRTMYPASGGRFLSVRDVEQRRRVLFLGDSIARRLFPGVDPIGRTVRLDGLPFTVIGTMQAKLQTSMNNGPDADRAVIPASVFQAVYGAAYVDQLLLRPRDVAEAPWVKRRIYEVLGARHGFHPEDERALRIWDFIEDARISNAIGLGVQIFLGAVGVLTLLVAGVGVANIMYVVVKERTREIGIKRAMGATRRTIMAQFLFEAVLICVLGGGAGLLLAAGLVFGVESLADTNEAMEMIGNPRFSWVIATLTVTILVGIGLLAGLFPARRAARLDPVESLRYE